EEREHALATPAPWLEDEPPEPFEPESVHDPRGQGDAAGELVEDAADADRDVDRIESGQVAREPSLLARHAERDQQHARPGRGDARHGLLVVRRARVRAGDAY